MNEHERIGNHGHGDNDDPDYGPQHRGQRGGPGRGGPLGPGSRRGFGRGPAGGTQSRAGRGAVGRSVLILLAERPMRGYEMIAVLDDRTDHAWKPSAGAMYPALERLIDNGLIEPVAGDDEDKQRYQLTKIGQRRVAEMIGAGISEPWAEVAAARGGDLRSAAAELMSSSRQIGRFGSPDQIDAAKVIITDATALLYRVLADGDPSAGERDAGDGAQRESSGDV